MTFKDHQSKTLKQMCCSPGEMLRRLLLHVLPKGLMRIRYYGFLANAIRARAIADIRKNLSEQLDEVTEVHKEKPCCPNCKNRSMVLIGITVRPRAIAEKERLS
ncbi:transposase [Vibrio agarivorans]|uniref:transposase n=1 Tax=Vibrio agarivorans TaxID=153622 RepID=UPI0025B2A0EC|nr:transposase [Vibrio agarivorans]MDN3660317.1 transposase [Vibrio agarivorans]